MGGGNYDRDDNDSRSTDRSSYSYNAPSYVSSPTQRTPKVPERLVCDPILDIRGKIRECVDIPGDPDGTPIRVPVPVAVQHQCHADVGGKRQHADAGNRVIDSNRAQAA